MSNAAVFSSSFEMWLSLVKLKEDWHLGTLLYEKYIFKYA